MGEKTFQKKPLRTCFYSERDTRIRKEAYQKKPIKRSLSKEAYQKKPIKRSLTVHVLTRSCPHMCKRDERIKNEAHQKSHMREKRPTHMKRDLDIWNKTHSYEKRPLHIKRDPNTCKETYDMTYQITAHVLTHSCPHMWKKTHI